MKRGWQKTVEMQAGGREHFEDEGAFQQHGLAFAGFPMGEGGVAGFAVEEMFERAEQDRMIGS